MATKAKAKVKPAVEPDFLTAVELALRLNVGDTKTLDASIARGDTPRPWLWLGPRKRLWRRDHYLSLVATGVWPKEAFKRD